MRPHGFVAAVSVVALALAGATSAYGGSATAGRDSSPLAVACTPKITTIGGHPASVQCGPGKATVRVGSKIFRYDGGTCDLHHPSGAKIILLLGTVVTGGAKKNGGQSDFSLLANTTGKQATVGMFWKGAVYGALSAKLHLNGTRTAGTFSGHVVQGGLAMSGSFHC